MVTRFQKAAVLFVLLACMIGFLGCGRSESVRSEDAAAAAKRSGEDEIDAAVQSWNTLLSGCKQNVEAVERTYQQILGPSFSSSSTVNFIENDVRKSDSLVAPIEGTMKFEIMLSNRDEKTMKFVQDQVTQSYQSRKTLIRKPIITLGTSAQDTIRLESQYEREKALFELEYRQAMAQAEKWSHSTTEYNLRFAFKGGSWTYVDGVLTNEGNEFAVTSNSPQGRLVSALLTPVKITQQPGSE